MCGIAGLLALRDGRPPGFAELAAMAGALAHRGPDGAGHHLDGTAGLVIQRLALVDPAGGHQPIAAEDGAVHVICNGELYDHRALRRTLERRGHTFRTGSDVEILVHLYEERGPAFVEGLRGMFALALWDARERRLVLARDPFGIKPLIYARLGRRLAFASELKALLALPEFPRDIDPAAVEAYLALNAVPAPATIFHAARKLPPGHRLLADADGVRVERYARPRPVPAGEQRRESGAELTAEARAAHGLGARPPGRGRARRRAALRRPGLERDHRARREPDRRAAADVQRRLRRGGVRRARRGAFGRAALRHRAP